MVRLAFHVWACDMVDMRALQREKARHTLRPRLLYRMLTGGGQEPVLLVKQENLNMGLRLRSDCGKEWPGLVEENRARNRRGCKLARQEGQCLYERRCAHAPIS